MDGVQAVVVVGVAVPVLGPGVMGGQAPAPSPGAPAQVHRVGVVRVLMGKLRVYRWHPYKILFLSTDHATRSLL